MYIHKDASIDSVFLNDFLPIVQLSIIQEENVSYEVLCDTQEQIYNTSNCSAKTYLAFVKRVRYECLHGSCVVVKTHIKDGVFIDTVYIVNDEF